MSNEWRLKTILKDLSQTVSLGSPIIGFTSIKAPKGNLEPMLVDVGATQQILDTFGYPSADYPAIQDCINYNQSFPLWISAPFDTATAKHGAILVTKQGTKSLVSGLENAEIVDFSDIEQVETIGTGNGTTTTFNFTTKLFDYYKNLSIDILVNGVSQGVSVTDEAIEVLSTVGGDTGTFTRATGVLAYTFATAPSLGDVIEVQYTIDVSDDCYYALISKSGQIDDLAVVTTSKGNGTFTFELNRRDKDDTTVYNPTPNSPYEVSIIEGAKNGFGQPIYLETVFQDDYYIVAQVNNSTFSTFVNDITDVPFAGGTRGVAIDGTEIVEGFNLLQDTDKYQDIKIVFDTTGDDLVVSAFESLRGTDATAGVRGRTKFLVPVTMQSVADTLSDTATAKNNVENRGINFFANPWCKHKDLYNNKPFICSGMGQIAKKYGDSKAISYGALSPMYIDENGIGGQLGSNIIELVYTATETQLQQLNSAGLIGIKKIAGSGFTIVGDRTSQSTILSDMSFTIHSDLTDFLLESIQPILENQLGKPNDEIHRTNVRAKAELIMSGVSQYLEDYVVKCDLGNNTDEIRAQRKFVLTIAVQFTPNSQTIEFIFTNSRVGTDLKQIVNKA